jgi:Subtilase family
MLFGQRHQKHRQLAAASVLLLAVGPGQVLGQTRPRMTIEKAAPVESPELVVLFQGGEYASNIPRVLTALEAEGLLQKGTVTLSPGDSVCDVYRRILPGGCTDATVALARLLNQQSAKSVKQISVGHTLVVPQVTLEPRPYQVKLDPRVKSDADRIADLTRRWEQTRKPAPQPDGYVAFTFAGFELRVAVRSDEALRDVRQRLRSLEIPNILVSARFEKPDPPKLYSATSPDKFWDDCIANQGKPPVQEEGDLRFLLARSPKGCTVKCTDKQCPDVLLVDTTVWPHPEIGDFLNADPTPCATTPPPDSPQNEECRTKPFNSALHHATHLAGIISARNNGQGIAGVAPGTLITPVCWPSAVETLNSSMDQRQEQGGQPPIYLFASEWLANEGNPLTNENDRLNPNKNPLGASIIDRRDLWVVAAGNGRDGFKQISRQSVESPANLGDKENVIVVTACSECLGNAQLVPSANRAVDGQPMVHVAAPGVGVLSTASTTEYARTDGTSQAAALVAGVAAAMKACYPEDYRAAHVVKTRLQTTSRPFPVVPAEGPRDAGLTSGIVDVETALLDPSSDWVKTNGGDWERVRVKRWSQNLEIVPRRVASLRMKDIHRLTRAGTGKWIAYSRVSDDSGQQHRGEVVRFGPGQLQPAEGGPLLAVLELCTGKVVNASDLDDVLLAKPFALRPNPARPCP